MRDLHIKYRIDIPKELLDYNEVLGRTVLPEDMEEWLDTECKAWQFFGYTDLWFECEKDRLYFKLRWLNN